MTTPTLAMGISAVGADEVARLAAAVGSLKTNLKELAGVSAGATVGNLEALANEFKAMRQELNATLQGLRTDLAANFQKAFAGAKTSAKEGMEQLDAEVQKGAARVTYSMRGIAMSKDVVANITGRNKQAVAEVGAQTKQDIDALAMVYESQVAKLEKQVSAIMKAATQGPNTLRGSGYIAWWDKIIDEQDAAVLKIETEYKKSISRLEKQVADVMKAAVQGPNTMRGSGYISWWDRVLSDREAAEAKLQAEYESEIGRLEKQVAGIMRAATQGPNTMRGSGYIAWWDKVLEEREAAEEKLQAQYTREIAQLEKQVASIMRAATQAPNTMRGSGYIKWWDSVIAEQEAAAAKIKAAQDAIFNRSVQGNVGQSMSVPVGGLNVSKAMDAGTYSSISSGSYGQLRNLEDVAAKAPKASAAMLGFAHEMEDAHSAARGLASGLNAMWLTWGNIVPLLAGAAISHAFVQVLRQGAEFQQTMAVVGYVAGQSAEEVDQLTAATMELARSGPYGPNEVAKAVKTLALAGLSAKEQIEALKPTLDFAMVGEMPLEKAAESLIAVSTAFGFQAKDMGVVADIIAKTAAVSMASVEGMTSSFKNASSIAQVYKVSIDDVALSLALMAQVGIKNQEAGTAVRAMYTQLATGGKQAQKILHDALDVNVIDNATKSMRPLSDILTDMVKSLSKFTFSDQLQALQKMSAQRGMKTLAADLTAFVTQAQASGESADTLRTKFEQMADAIKNAPGFSAMTAIGLSTTALNSMKSVASALQSSLVTAFSAVNNEVIGTSKLLVDTFNSKGFQDGLSSLISGIGSVVKFLIDNVRALEAVAIGYVAGKAAVIAYTTAMSIAAVAQASLAAATVEGAAAATGAAIADGVLATATTAVGVASTGAAAGTSLLVASLGPIAILLAAAGAAYFMFAKKAADGAVDIDKAHAKATAAIDNYTSTVISGMDKEIERLEKIAAERAKGTTGAIAAAIVESNLTRDTMERLNAEEMSVLNLARSYKQMARDKLAASEYGKTVDGEAGVKRLDAEVNQATMEMQATFTRQDRAMNAFYAKQSKLFGLSAAEAAAAKAEIANNNAKTATGSKHLDLSPPGSRGGLRADHDAATIEAQMRDELAVLKKQMDDRRAILESEHKNEIVSEGAYQAQLLQLENAYYQQELAKLGEYKQAREVEYNSRVAEARTSKEIKPEARQQVLKNLKDDWEKFVSTVDRAKDSLESDISRRQEVAGNEEIGKLAKLKKEDDTFFAHAEATIRKESELELAHIRLANATDEVRAAEDARIKVSERFAPQLEKVQAEYEKTQQAVSDFSAQFSGDAIVTDAVMTEYARLQKQVEALRLELERLRTEQGKATGIAVQGAEASVEAQRIAKRHNDAKKLADDMSTQLAEAVFSGGQGGFQKLRDWAKSYFVKEFITVKIKALVEPAMTSLANSIYGFGGGSGGGGMIGSGLSSLSSLLGGGGGGGGFGAVDTALGASLAGGSGAALGGTTFGVVDSGLAASLGASTGLMGAIGVAMPYLGVALMAASALGLFGHKGGPKTESGYGYGIDRTPNPATSQTLAQGMQAQYASLASGLGGTPGKLDLGVFTAQDPQGTAQTQLAVNAALNGQSIYSRANRLGGTENVGRSDADLQAAIAEETSRVVLEALQQSGLVGAVGDYLKQLGDINKLSGGDLTTAMQHIQQAQALEMRLFNLTSTDEEKIAHQRAQELAGLDDLNKATAERVYALEDEQKAQAKAADAIQKAIDSAKASQDFASGINTNIHQYLDKLNGTSAGMLSPKTQLDNSQNQFEYQYLLAKAGNKTALQGITGYADQYISAQSAYTASGPETQNTLEYIKQKLSSLPEVQSDAEYLATTMMTASKTVVDGLSVVVQQEFGKLDTNVDGLLDFTELKNALGGVASDDQIRALIQHVDTNGDGMISKQEAIRAGVIDTLNSNADYLSNSVRDAQVAQTAALWNAIWGASGVTSAKFDAIDTNLDGLLNFNELKLATGATDDQIRALITRVDTNSDGMIDKQEAIRAGVIDAVNRASDTIFNGLWGQAGYLATKFDTIDTNLDGLLNFNELKNALGPLASDDTIHQLIMKADTNGDGQISKLEAIKAAVDVNTTVTANTAAAQISATVATSGASSGGTSGGTTTSNAFGSYTTGSWHMTGMPDWQGGFDTGTYYNSMNMALAGDKQAQDQLVAWGLASYDKGTSYVMKDQLALIHQGEAVLTKEDNASRRVGGGGDVKLDLLTKRVEQLTAVMSSYARQSLDKTERVAVAVEGGVSSSMLERVA